MEAFQAVASKLPPPHHHHPHQRQHPPPMAFLQSARYVTAKSHHPHGSGSAFNSWNDYLGLATLITKAVGEEKGFGGDPASPSSSSSSSCCSPHAGAAGGMVVAAAALGPPDDEEDDDEEAATTPYFGSALDLRDLELCGAHPADGLLEERFADFSPFSGGAGPTAAAAAAVLFDCASEPLERDRAPAWGGAAEPRLQSGPKPAGRLLKPDLQVCVFCRNNKEAVALYTTHILKGPDGRVLCPVLRRYTCPLCGASGDNAHTIKYCPLSKMQAHATKQIKNARNVLGKKIR
ncbi:nanos homolog 1 [Monodelphis domestica]|uniref:Nanos C2HC-type zinc finger 1 n=1 Tax=Monodelphis domestica TaxID=13616 RepID=F7GJT4_MONDO|nr:nanos homolog 1 [Monodelphis domestica]